jgi:hypothetical protein
MTAAPMYIRTRGNQGWELRRIGAIDACIICGMPNLPGAVTFAHIHTRDLAFLPNRDPTRVFCLCWQHHHAGYDQGYISTVELLEAEDVWIANERRPTPHPRDIALMKRVEAGEVRRCCVWSEKRVRRECPTMPAIWGRIVQDFAVRLIADVTAQRGVQLADAHGAVPH